MTARLRLPPRFRLSQLGDQFLRSAAPEIKRSRILTFVLAQLRLWNDVIFDEMHEAGFAGKNHAVLAWRRNPFLRAGQLLTGDFWTLRAVVVSRRNKDRPNIRRSRFLFASQPLRFIGREISVLQPEGHSSERFLRIAGAHCLDKPPLFRSRLRPSHPCSHQPSHQSYLRWENVSPRSGRFAHPSSFCPSRVPQGPAIRASFRGGKFMLRPGQACPVERDAASECHRITKLLNAIMSGHFGHPSPRDKSWLFHG
jgi:hypothetical protein